MPKQEKRSLEYHGATCEGKQSDIYQIWSQIKQRCFNPNCPKYKNYGARGIDMDPRWRDSFSTFQSEIGSRPSKEHSVGRIDNNKGYWPGNVRWETKTQQMRNTRTNHLVQHDGEMKTISQLSEETGLDHRRLQYRLANQGLSEEEAAKRPIERGSLYIEWKGEYHSLTTWSKRLGIPYQTLHTRIYRKGKSVEEAFKAK